MSAWLRSNPATETPSNKTTNVRTTSSAITPPPLSGASGPSIASRGARGAATTSVAAEYSYGVDDRPDRSLPPRARTPGRPVHGDLGGRPRGGARPHVRGPGSLGIGGESSAHCRDRPGPPGVGVRGRALHPSWNERSGRTPPRQLQPRALPLRSDATRVATTSRPGYRTWTSMGSGPRSTSRPRSRVSAGGCSSTPPTARWVLACIRAWNDWLFEEWHTPHPERIVPLGITYLADPELAARGDPTQRRAWLHIRHLSRASPCDRPPVALGARPLGSDHGSGDRDGLRRLSPRRQLGPGDRPAGRRARSRSVPPCSDSCPSLPVRNGCGPNIPCGIRTSRSR